MGSCYSRPQRGHYSDHMSEAEWKVLKLTALVCPFRAVSTIPGYPRGSYDYNYSLIMTILGYSTIILYPVAYIHAYDRVHAHYH